MQATPTLIVLLTALQSLVMSTVLLLPAYLWLPLVRRYGPSVEALACRYLLVGIFVLPISLGAMQSVGVRGLDLNAWTATRFEKVEQSESVAKPRSFTSAETLPTVGQPTNLSPAIIDVKQSITQTTVALPTTNIQQTKATRINYFALASNLALGAWMVCSLGLIIRILRSWLCIVRIERTAVPDPIVQDDCRQLAIQLGYPCPRVVRSRWIDTPCQAGIFRPVVVLPAAESSSAELTSILVHELAHIARRDVTWIVIFRLTIALLPFQPLLWWLLRRHESAMEHACDDVVVRHTAEPATYAQQLLELASSRRSHQVLGVSMVARPSMLGQRIRRIMDAQNRRDYTSPRRLRCWLGCALLLQCVIVSWLWLPAHAHESSTAQQSTQAASKPEEPSTPLDWIVSGQVIGVNGQPVSGASVSVTSMKYWSFRQDLVTDGDGKFSVKLGPAQFRIYELTLVARSTDDQALSYDSVQRPQKGEGSQPVVLKLELPRTVDLRVVDQADQPVANCKALLKLGGPYLTAVTNSSGVARFTIPQHQPIHRAAAWKDGVGFDFVEYKSVTDQMVEPFIRMPEPAAEFPVGGIETLKLTGAKRVSVFVSDEDGRPIPNVQFRVGQFQKSATQSFATSMLGEYTLEELVPATDAAGRTEIACIPTWHQASIELWSESRDYERKHVRHPMWSDEPIRISLQRKVSIRGRVSRPDGEPASGVMVRTEGDTYAGPNGSLSINYDQALTAADGSYELRVPPRHLYMVGVENERFAAPVQTLVLDSGQNATDINFALKTPNRIRGRVVDADDGQPVADCHVAVSQYGPRDRSANTALPREYADKPWNAPVFIHSLQTDGEGCYELLLGEGNFEIFSQAPRAKEVIEFTSAPDLQLKDLEVNAGEAFNGMVTIDGKPAADAVVEAFTTILEGWVAKTDAAGKFKTRRPGGLSFLRVLSADAKHGAMKRIDTESAVELELRELGKAKGRLISATGEPLPKRTLGYAVRFKLISPKFHPSALPTWSCFGEAILTNEHGEFEFRQLVPFQEYAITYYEDVDQDKSQVIRKFKVDAGEQFDLGDLRVTD